MSTRLPSLGPRGEGWLAAQILLLAAIVLAGTLGPAWHGVARTASVGFGALLLSGGALLAGRGVRDLRDNLTPLPHPRDDATLVDRGAYGIVRHPIYGGLIMGAFGWGLVTASLVTLVFAALLAVFLDLKSRREESWLRERFPAYESYSARTRRMIPYVY